MNNLDKAIELFNNQSPDEEIYATFRYHADYDFLKTVYFYRDKISFEYYLLTGTNLTLKERTDLHLYIWKKVYSLLSCI